MFTSLVIHSFSQTLFIQVIDIHLILHYDDFSLLNCTQYKAQKPLDVEATMVMMNEMCDINGSKGEV